MGININTKGKEGEREFVNKYQAFFPDTLKRNLLQTREGGADISGCAPFQIEIKRHQDISLGNKNTHWRQVLKACKPDEIPVVAFRPNKAKWRFLLPATLMGIQIDEWVECSEDVFLQLVLQTYSDPK